MMACEREDVSPVLELRDGFLAPPAGDQILAVDAWEQFLRVLFVVDAARYADPFRVILSGLGIGELMRISHSAAMGAKATIQRSIARETGFDEGVTSGQLGEGWLFGGFYAVQDEGGTSVEVFRDKFDREVMIAGDVGED